MKWRQRTVVVIVCEKKRQENTRRESSTRGRDFQEAARYAANAALTPHPSLVIGHARFCSFHSTLVYDASRKEQTRKRTVRRIVHFIVLHHLLHFLHCTSSTAVPNCSLDISSYSSYLRCHAFSAPSPTHLPLHQAVFVV